MEQIPNFLFERDFWLDLREKTEVKGIIGEGRCNKWSLQSYRLLEAMGFAHLFEVIVLEKKVSELNRNRQQFHNWLEMRDGKKRIFLADGIAGQFFSEYPLGFYARIEEIPQGMQNFYNSITWSYVPEKDLYEKIIAEKRLAEPTRPAEI